MINYKAVGFDWGNVLNNYNHHITVMANYFDLSQAKLEVIMEKHITPFHLGLPEMEFWKRVCLEAKVEPPQEPIWKKLFEKTVIINDDLFAMVGKLNDLGYKTAIISNAEAPNAEYIDGHIKNNRPFFFNAYVLSCDSDIKAVKPNPEIYLKACKVLEIYPEELVFVDDRKENIQGAEKLGISGILHVNNKTTIKKISDLLEISLK